jgi:hypothetical protein
MPKPLELREDPKLLRLLELREDPKLLRLLELRELLRPDLKPLLEEEVLELEPGMLLLAFIVELLLTRLLKPGEEEVFLT